MATNEEAGPLPKKGPASQPSTAAHDTRTFNDVHYLDAAFEFVILRWFAELPYGLGDDVDALAMYAARRLREVAR